MRAHKLYHQPAPIECIQHTWMPLDEHICDQHHYPLRSDQHQANSLIHLRGTYIRPLCMCACLCVCVWLFIVVVSFRVPQSLWEACKFVIHHAAAHWCPRGKDIADRILLVSYSFYIIACSCALFFFPCLYATDTYHELVMEKLVRSSMIS